MTIITGQTRSLPHSKCPKNTPNINLSSQEGKNNKQSSQKTIIRRTMCKEYDRITTTISHWESCMRSSPTLTHKPNADHMLQQQEETATTRGNQDDHTPYTTANKDTIVNCLVLLFERVPEVTIDQNQGSMIDWVKEVNNEKYWKSLICVGFMADSVCLQWFADMELVLFPIRF
jgi:hypothetical protein